MIKNTIENNMFYEVNLVPNKIKYWLSKPKNDMLLIDEDSLFITGGNYK